EGQRVQLLPPVEGGRTVVGEEFSWIARVDRVRKLAGLLDVRRRRLAPKKVRIRPIREASGYGRRQAAVELEEAFWSALAPDERAVGRIGIARDEAGAVRIGPGDDQRPDAHHVGREPRRDEFLDELRGRDDDLSPEVAALLGGGELILEVDAGGPGLDHGLHEFERVEGPAESGFRVRD